jgi:heme-degrading monooxygenase HmoA
MIRNVTLVEFKPGTSDAYVATIVDAMRALRIPGMLSLSLGKDLSLKEGNMHFAVVADFVDAAAFRAFDTDPEHVRIRKEMTGPALVRYERVQYEVETGGNQTIPLEALNSSNDE